MTPETLPILYQDEWMVAVHKPAGLLVHRSIVAKHDTRFAVQIVRDQLGRAVHPPHRLDRGTSGVLLFALDRDIARVLGQQFEARMVDKKYVAVVRGHPPEAGTIDHPLTRQFDPIEWAGEAMSEEPQPAVTHFRTLATVELPWAVDRYPTSRYALVELVPETGRQHQLRRHLKHAAHPIIGDGTYGKGVHNRAFRERFGNERMLLACVGLAFSHPVSGAPMYVHAPLAEDFAAVVRALGWSPDAVGAPRARESEP